MGLSNYSVSLTLKSNEPLEEMGDFEIFRNILTLQDSDECFLHISTELGYLFHSENQFNNKFRSQYGKIEYSEILSKETLEKLGTLQDARPWFESNELTLIDSTDEDFEILEPQKFGLFLLDLKRYLERFKWNTEKPPMMGKLDEVNLLILLANFCSKNNVQMKMIEA
ncbi:hypothetical protein [Marinoscillum luteum]|uniref:Uncharacterized protein n=1 Tax=Marinoscillum luteum TaxID=861051 RepID=A0ABW7N2J7_9BACT